MPFIRKHRKAGKLYFSLAESKRIDGRSHPVQQQIEWLGDYDQAVTVLEKLRRIDGRPIAPETRQALLLALASKAGRIGDESALSLPAQKYGCIVADPPWAYRLRSDDESHRNRLDYQTMNQEEILALPIPELADFGCVLWLWTTNNHMADACHCLDTWGFELKTILTWVKVTKAGNVAIGTGHWLRNATEHCLLATRGKVSSFKHLGTLTNQSTVIQAPRREHSRKPDEFYTLVEQFCSGSKLEMFARQKRSGWDCWGNEVEKFG